MTIVTAIGNAGRGSRKRLRQIDLDKVPAWAKGARRAIGDKEEAVGRRGDGSVKRSSGSGNSWNERIIGIADRDCSSSRDRGNRKDRRQGCGIGGGIIRNVLELKQGRVVCRQRRRKPHVVVHLNIEGRTERVWEWGMGMVEISEVGGIEGCTGKESRWKRREGLSRVLEQSGVWVTISTDMISTEASRGNNFVGATLAVGKFGNCAGSGIAVDLDACHDQVTNSIQNRGARGIGAFTVQSATFFGQKAQDLFSELSSGAG